MHKSYDPADPQYLALRRACLAYLSELERLKVRAVGRCRELLMQRVWDFRKPKTNMQASLGGGQEGI